MKESSPGREPTSPLYTNHYYPFHHLTGLVMNAWPRNIGVFASKLQYRHFWVQQEDYHKLHPVRT